MRSGLNTNSTSTLGNPSTFILTLGSFFSHSVSPPCDPCAAAAEPPHFVPVRLLQLIHNISRDFHDKIIKCEVHNAVGKSEESKTLDISCKYTPRPGHLSKRTLYLIRLVASW